MLPENGRFPEAGSFDLEEEGDFESLEAGERCTVDRNSEELRTVEENEDVQPYEAALASGGLEQTEEEQSVSAAKKASAAGAKRCHESGSAKEA